MAALNEYLNEYGAWVDIDFNYGTGEFRGKHPRFRAYSLSRAVVYGADMVWLTLPGSRAHSGRFIGAIMTGLVQMAARERALVTEMLAAVAVLDREDDRPAIAYNVFKAALRVTRATRRCLSVGTTPPAAEPPVRS